MLTAPYTKIKELVLGKKYELSFAFVTPLQMRKAMKYKKEPAKKLSNVLAFPLSKTSGEILICKQAAKPYTVDYLLIHGVLHLKGLKHSDTMDSTEHRLVKKFGFNVHEQTNSRH
jgi:ssRNA-specific RNase YbeY (16S rRNA maturation enzyme)